MPVISASSSGNDGLMYIINQSSWANARDATSASTLLVGSQRTTNFTQVVRSAGRGGGNVYSVYRSFLFFDTSGITATVASAELSIRGYSANDGSVIAVKSTAFGGDGGTALAASDFNAISGWSAGSSLAGSATVYGAQKTTTNWTTSGGTDFTATSDLLTDMKNNDVVIICFMDYTNDYLNVALTSNGYLNIGAFYAEYSGVSRDPKIVYTTGYGNTVNGVAGANIKRIKGQASGLIKRVNGV